MIARSPKIAKRTDLLLRTARFAAMALTLAACSGKNEQPRDANRPLDVGYVVVRSPNRLLATTLRQLTFLPYLVPGIAFAVAYLSLFAVPRGPVPALYGTVFILMLALIAEQMPYASRAGISAMMQLGKDPEEAAQVAGAGWFRRLITIVLPIQKGSLATGILLPGRRRISVTETRTAGGPSAEPASDAEVTTGPGRRTPRPQDRVRAPVRAG